MNNFSFWQKWLFVVAISISLFGIVMAFFNGTVIFKLMDNRINPIFWQNSTITSSAENFQTFVYGILGATIAGWGIIIAFIARYPFRAKEKWSWYCLLIGLMVWYLTDTSISIYFGVYFNAFVINTPFFLLTIIPLILTKRYFQQKHEV